MSDRSASPVLQPVTIGDLWLRNRIEVADGYRLQHGGGGAVGRDRVFQNKWLIRGLNGRVTPPSQSISRFGKRR